MNEAIETIEGFASLKPNWNSYDATPITEKARKVAIELLEKFKCRYGLFASPPSDVFPVAHGGVYLEWTRPNVSLEVEVTPEGELAFYLREVIPANPDLVFWVILYVTGDMSEFYKCADPYAQFIVREQGD